MKNSDFYISPYDNKRKRKQEPGFIVRFLVELLVGIGIITMFLCAIREVL